MGSQASKAAGKAARRYPRQDRVVRPLQAVEEASAAGGRAHDSKDAAIMSDAQDRDLDSMLQQIGHVQREQAGPRAPSTSPAPQTLHNRQQLRDRFEADSQKHSTPKTCIDVHTIREVIHLKEQGYDHAFINKRFQLDPSLLPKLVASIGMQDE